MRSRSSATRPVASALELKVAEVWNRLLGSSQVGLEDNFYLPSGTMASSNGQLVEQAAQLVALTGRQVANVDDARALLSLPPR